MKHTVELNCFLSSAAMNHDERVRRNHRSIGISITVRYAPLGSSHNRKPTRIYIYCVCLWFTRKRHQFSAISLSPHTQPKPKKNKTNKNDFPPTESKSNLENCRWTWTSHSHALSRFLRPLQRLYQINGQRTICSL